VADEVLVVAGAFRASRSLPFLTSEASDAGRDQRFFVPQNDGDRVARTFA